MKLNQNVRVLDLQGNIVENARITKLLSFSGLKKEEAKEAIAGDIVVLAGLEKANVSDTIASPEVTMPLESKQVDPPTLSMTFSVNDSPLAGTEGSKLTSSVLKDRLFKEMEGNVSIKISKAQNEDSFDVAGRGELQLGILIETMRREGFEISISKPRVLLKKDDNGKTIEPYEELTVDLDSQYAGSIVESLNKRKGKMIEMKNIGIDKTRLIFHIPSRGLIGYYSQFLTETKGTGTMNKIFYQYGPYLGKLETRHNGVLISMANGKSVAYALWNLEDRGQLFINPNTPIYQGMIIGEHNRDNDLEVNPIKGKQLSNVRASGRDEAVRLTPPRQMTLEQALSYINDDELVEVTPKSIRLRKKYLDPHERKKNQIK